MYFSGTIKRSFLRVLRVSEFNHLKAVLLVVGACLLLAGMDALGKSLMVELHPVQVVWARYSFHTLLVGLYLIAMRQRDFLIPQRPTLQVLRGLCLLAVTFAMYFSIRSVPLADATAIMFFAPVLVTLLAGWLLKEALTPGHWLAAGIGFIGVLLIAQPGFNGVQPLLLLPLVSAIALAFYFLLTRILHNRDRDTVTLFHTTASGTLIMCLLVPFFWAQPGLAGWVSLLLIGALGATGHLMLIHAFRLQNASTLSPWLNTQIVAASLFSLWVFDDPLSTGFLSGALLIILAGLLSWINQQNQGTPPDR